jgi:hypothetical protein
MLAGTIPSPKIELGGRALNDASLAKMVDARARELNPEMAAQGRATATGGAMYESARNTQIHNDARRFAHTSLAPLASSLDALGRAPAIKQVKTVYTTLANTIMDFNSKFIEEQPQWAALGRAMRRDVQDVEGTWNHALMLGPDAVEELARGYLKTEKQIHYAEQVRQVYGKWQALSPDGRRFLINYAPFGLWLRAATRFVVLTLPARHPIKTAIIAAAFEATDEQRKAVGLSLWADKPLPPYLQGSLPLGNGGIAPVSALTSFGMFNDYADNLGRTAFPWINASLEALRGSDWKGDKLVQADGSPMTVPQRLGIALLTQAEAFAPWYGLGRGYASYGFPMALSPVRPITDPHTLGYLRSLQDSQQITVPISGGGSSSGGAPWKDGSTSSGAAPWSHAPSSSGGAPWK